MTIKVKHLLIDIENYVELWRNILRVRERGTLRLGATLEVAFLQKAGWSQGNSTGVLKKDRRLKAPAVCVGY